MKKKLDYDSNLHPRVAGEMAKHGLTDRHIAMWLEINLRTFHKWMHKYPEFYHAVNDERNIANGMVEDSLLKASMTR